jgi:hypothetical protein
MLLPLQSVALLGAPPRSAPLWLCVQTTWDADAWQRTACWDGLSTFDRMKLLRGLLDGDLSLHECNHAAWRGMGYSVRDGTLHEPDGSVCTSSPPDVLGDEVQLALLEAQLPLGDTLDEEEALGMLDTVVEALHGEDLTRTLVAEGDPNFLARRTLVRWLYQTQAELAMG